MFVIISKKKYDAIMSKISNLEEKQTENFKKVNEKLAEVEEKANKRYVSDNFSKDKEKPKSWNQIMDEYLNGENKENKGGN